MFGFKTAQIFCFYVGFLSQEIKTFVYRVTRFVARLEGGDLLLTFVLKNRP